MSAPTVTSVDVRLVPRSGTVGVVVTGTDFDGTPVTGAVASVALSGGSGLTISDQTVDSATQMTLTVVAASDATTGFWDLTVTQTDGSDTLVSAFTVSPSLVMATPPSRQIILYSFYHYASGSYDDGDRGFPAGLVSGGWASILDNGTSAGSYIPFQTEAAAQGCTLGFLPQNPFGRGSATATVPVSGNATSQRLDQRRQLWEDGFTSGNASYADFLANTEPRETIVYVGSCWLSTSAGTVVGEGYYDLLNLGYGVAFDALTQHEGTTPLFAEVQALDTAGHDVITEANGLLVDGGSQGLPAIAFANLWGLGTRMQPADAPDGSIWWWRTSDDGAWSLSAVAAFLATGEPGTRRLAVRLDQLTEEERTALYQLAAEYETYTNDAYYAESVVIPGDVASSVKVASTKTASVEIRQTVSASVRCL